MVIEHDFFRRTFPKIRCHSTELLPRTRIKNEQQIGTLKIVRLLFGHLFECRDVMVRIEKRQRRRRSVRGKDTDFFAQWDQDFAHRQGTADTVPVGTVMNGQNNVGCRADHFGEPLPVDVCLHKCVFIVFLCRKVSWFPLTAQHGLTYMWAL
jgi:hypothetical protein